MMFADRRGTRPAWRSAAVLLLVAAALVELIWRWEHVSYAARTGTGRWLERWARRHDL